MFERFKRFFSRTTRPDGWPGNPQRVFWSGRTDAGVVMDHDNSLRQSTVWACVQYLTKSVAQIDWNVVRELENGDVVPVPSSPVDWILNHRPNAEMGSFTFRQTMLGYALLWGNAYAEIQRDQAGRVVALWPINPDRVRPKRDVDGVLYYEVWNGANGKEDMDAMDIFHIKGFGNGPIGYDVVSFAAQSIGWARATEIFGSQFFGDGMNPSGIVSMERALTPDAMRELQAKMTKFRGPRGDKTLYLDKQMTWTPVSRTPNEAQFIETRAHQVSEICRWFGVPPHKVMHLANATFSNIEHQSIEVVVDSIVPWVKVFEQEADHKLFGSNRMGLETRMRVNSLLRGDSAARAELYRTLFQVGAASPNTILRLEGMNSLGPEGDQHFVPMNMIPVDLAAEAAMARAAPKPPAVPDGANPDEPPTEPANRRRVIDLTLEPSPGGPTNGQGLLN